MGSWITDRFSSFGLIFSVLLDVTLVTVVTCYNLDTRSPVIRTGEDETFFGFSAAIHSVGEDDMLIVGAPRGDSGLPEKTGAIYKCPVLPFDDTSNCEKFSEERRELTRDKSDQWLGATVRSAGTDDTVVACAPFSKEIRSDTGIHPSGKCIFYSSNFTHANTIVPCEPPVDDPTKASFKFKSHCLAGISAEKIGADFVIGGPGSFTAQGSVFTLGESTGQEYITPAEEEKESDGNYQGYSVTYGNFSGSDELDIVTGAPRGSMLLGLVRIYTQDMVLLRELEGYQTGSYFGESVAASDLNDDGFDDLVVGASNYWNRETHQTDVGQVIIFYQTSVDTFDASNTVITGQHERGRFGLVVTALGDINNDGVNDLAIGAPYEGNGAVYIYNGRRGEKIKAKPSQILRPSDLNIPLERFGFSLSANRDADKNMYPDLLVGSYLSDKVVLFRTKPVIRPWISITFRSERVYLKTKNVTWGGKLVSGFGGTICMSYSGLGTKDEYDFDITITMDAEKQVTRAELYTDQTTSNRVITKEMVTISKTDEQVHCEEFNAFLKDQIVDKVSPITVRVSTDVIQDLDSLPEGEIPHVLDVYTQVKDAQIPIFVNCLNERCSPDLQTSVKSDKPILHFGDDTEVTLTVTVANTADEAFGAFLFVLLPDDTRYLSSSLINSDLAIICEMIHQAKSVACDIGNPLPKKTEVVFEIRLQINPVPGDRTTLPIQLIANSTSEEYLDTRNDNNANFTWELQPEVGLLLDGSANIDQLIYNDTDMALERNVTDPSTEKVDKVVHTYWVQNLGPAKISSASLEVKWPMKTEDGTYLLYLTSVSLSNGETCNVEGGVDPDNLSGDGNEVIGSSRESIKRSRHASPQVMAQEDGLPRVVSADCSLPGYSGCINITCNLGRMDKDGMNTILTIESVLMLDSLLQDGEPQEWEITSSAVFTVHSIPYITQPEKTPSKVKTLSLRTIPLTFTQKEPIPLWAIILSVVLGTLVLILLVFCLYKAGFFKRNKIDLDEIKRTYERQRDMEEMNMEGANME